jgi:uncharacterized protein (TIGR03437 family)
MVYVWYKFNSMRIWGLIGLLSLACVACIAGFDAVPERPQGPGGPKVGPRQPGYCNPPAIAAVTDGASDSTTLSPGSIAVIFWCDNTVPPPTTPVTSVLVRGVPSYAYPSQPAPAVTSTPAGNSPSYLQLTVQIPVGIKPGHTNIQLKRGTQVLSHAPIDLSAFAPGIFTVNEPGSGLALAEHADGSFVTAACPATPGEEVAIYAEGLGPTTPLVATGDLPTGLAFTNTVPVLTVGANEAQIMFSGLSPSLIGVYQINFVVPASGSGQKPLQIKIGQKLSNNVQLPVGPNSCAP